MFPEEVYRACRRIHGVIFLGCETLVVTFCVGSSAAFVPSPPPASLDSEVNGSAGAEGVPGAGSSTYPLRAAFVFPSRVTRAEWAGVITSLISVFKLTDTIAR